MCYDKKEKPTLLSSWPFIVCGGVGHTSGDAFVRECLRDLEAMTTFYSRRVLVNLIGRFVRAGHNNKTT